MKRKRTITGRQDRQHRVYRAKLIRYATCRVAVADRTDTRGYTVARLIRYATCRVAAADRTDPEGKSPVHTHSCHIGYIYI